MTSWSFRLIAANVVVYIISMAVPGFTEQFMLIPADILARPWTIVTYMFLHGGLWHLFFNMLGLYFFGPRLELEIGAKHFLWLYFLSGMMGALLSFVFTPYTAIIGASGAIFGVLIGYAHFWPRDQIYIWGVLPIEARWFVIILTGLSLFGGFGGMGGNIAHFAHLGGFAGGWLYIRWLDRKRREQMIPHEIRVPTPSSWDLRRWSSIQRDKLHEVNREEYDRIMKKLSTEGGESLTVREREFLDRFSQG
jgi:membrane associated rhomboid family serine protease